MTSPLNWEHLGPESFLVSLVATRSRYLSFVRHRFLNTILLLSTGVLVTLGHLSIDLGWDLF